MQIVSGSPVLKKSTDGDSVRWHTSKTTLYLDASLDALGGQARDAVQLGFGAWMGSGAKLPGLSFDSTTGATFGPTPNGKSEIMYGPITIKGHENDLALTITFSDPKSGEVVEADMIFNSTHPYGLLPAKRRLEGSGARRASATTSTTCKRRHPRSRALLRLGEDYDVKTATMYYTTGRCETNKRALQTSDETTMDCAVLGERNGQFRELDGPHGRIRRHRKGLRRCTHRPRQDRRHRLVAVAGWFARFRQLAPPQALILSRAALYAARPGSHAPGRRARSLEIRA